jgi:hypothetical protein
MMPKSVRPSRSEVIASCIGALELVGFERFKKDSVDRFIKDGFRCWVGLNTGVHPTFIRVNPSVGIHAEQIGRIRVELFSDAVPSKYSRTVATYAVHMGELSPNEEQFIFAAWQGMDTTAARLARLYLDVGYDYAARIADYETLMDLVRGRVHMYGGYPESYIACQYRLGRLDDARASAAAFERRDPQHFSGLCQRLEHLIARREGAG